MGSPTLCLSSASHAGDFPVWLAPEQVRVPTIGQEELPVNHAKKTVSELRANMVRVETDFSVTLVIGAVSVRFRGKGNLGAKPKAEVVADI